MSLLYTYQPAGMISSVYSFSFLSLLLLLFKQELPVSGSKLVHIWAFLNLYSYFLDIFPLKFLWKLVKAGIVGFLYTFCNSLSHQRTRWKQCSSLGHFRISLMLPWEKSSWDLESMARGRETSYFFLPLISRSTVLYFLPDQHWGDHDYVMHKITVDLISRDKARFCLIYSLKKL